MATTQYFSNIGLAHPCGPFPQLFLQDSDTDQDTTDTIGPNGRVWNRSFAVETTFPAGDWTVFLELLIIPKSAPEPTQKVRVTLSKVNRSNCVELQRITQEDLVVSGIGEFSTTPVNPGAITFNADDHLLLVQVNDQEGDSLKRIRYAGLSGSTFDSRVSHEDAVGGTVHNIEATITDTDSMLAVPPKLSAKWSLKATIPDQDGVVAMAGIAGAAAVALGKRYRMRPPFRRQKNWPPHH